MKETASLGDSGLAISNKITQTALTNESGQVIVFDSENDQLIQASRDTQSDIISFELLKKGATAENHVTSIPEYDSNHVLKLHGFPKLTKM